MNGKQIVYAIRVEGLGDVTKTNATIIKSSRDLGKVLSKLKDDLKKLYELQGVDVKGIITELKNQKSSLVDLNNEVSVATKNYKDLIKAKEQLLKLEQNLEKAYSNQAENGLNLRVAKGRLDSARLEQDKFEQGDDKARDRSAEIPLLDQEYVELKKIQDLIDADVKQLKSLYKEFGESASVDIDSVKRELDKLLARQQDEKKSIAEKEALIKKAASVEGQSIDAVKGKISELESVKARNAEAEKQATLVLQALGKNSVSEYDRLKAQIALLTREYANLLSQGKGNQNQTKSLLEELNRLKDLESSIAASEKQYGLEKNANLSGQIKSYAQLESRIKVLQQRSRDFISQGKQESYAAVKNERELGRVLAIKQKIVDEERRVKNEAVASGKVSVGAYKRLSAQLIVLRDEYKNVAAEFGESSDQAKRLLSDVTKLDKALKKIDENAGQSQRSVGNYRKALGGLGTSVAQVFGIGTGIALASQVVSQFGETLDEAKEKIIEFDERVADLSKVTNLSVDASRALAVEISQIDTRTSVKGLLDLAVAGGRLGLASKDIKGFVTESDKLFIALGDTLEGSAEDVALIVGKMAQNFGLIEKFGVAEALNKVGSVMNALGATSAAQEPHIIDFTNRLAGIAGVAKITIAEIAALGATFDAGGQSMEIAATSMQRFLPELAIRSARFAKIVKMQKEEFEDLLRRDSFAAMKLVIESAKSAEGGLIGLAETLGLTDQEAARSAQIFAFLSDNIDRLERNLATANNQLANNTSINQEAEKKQSTLAAQVENTNRAYEAMIISMDNGNGIISDVMRGWEEMKQRIYEVTAAFNDNEIGFGEYIAALYNPQYAQGVIDRLNNTKEAVEKLTEKYKTLNEFEKGGANVERILDEAGVKNKTGFLYGVNQSTGAVISSGKDNRAAAKDQARQEIIRNETLEKQRSIVKSLITDTEKYKKLVTEQWGRDFDIIDPVELTNFKKELQAVGFTTQEVDAHWTELLNTINEGLDKNRGLNIIKEAQDFTASINMQASSIQYIEDYIKEVQKRIFDLGTDTKGQEFTVLTLALRQLKSRLSELKQGAKSSADAFKESIDVIVQTYDQLNAQLEKSVGTEEQIKRAQLENDLKSIQKQKELIEQKDGFYNSSVAKKLRAAEQELSAMQEGVNTEEEIAAKTLAFIVARDEAEAKYSRKKLERLADEADAAVAAKTAEIFSVEQSGGDVTDLQEELAKLQQEAFGKRKELNERYGTIEKELTKLMEQETSKRKELLGITLAEEKEALAELNEIYKKLKEDIAADFKDSDSFLSSDVTSKDPTDEDRFKLRTTGNNSRRSAQESQAKKEYLDVLKGGDEKAIEAAKERLEARLLEIKQQYNQAQLDDARATNQKTLSLEEQVLEDEIAMEERKREESEKTKKKKIEDAEKLKEALKNAAIDAAGKIVGAFADRSIDRIEETKDREIDAVEEEYSAKIAAAKDDAQLQSNLKKQLEKEKEEINKKAAKEKQKIRIKEAIAETALAIIRGAPNLLAMGLAALTGASQIIAIKAQKFAKGGRIKSDGTVEGPSHSSGGVQDIINGVQAELEGGERKITHKDGTVDIVNKKSASIFRPELDFLSRFDVPNKKAIVSRINSYNGNGIAFMEQGGRISPSADGVYQKITEQSVTIKYELTEGLSEMSGKMAKEVSDGVAKAIKSQNIGGNIREGARQGLVEANQRNVLERQLRKSEVI